MTNYHFTSFLLITVFKNWYIWKLKSQSRRPLSSLAFLISAVIIYSIAYLRCQHVCLSLSAWTLPRRLSFIVKGFLYRCFLYLDSQSYFWFRLIKASRINITFLMLNLMKQLCDDPFWWIFCDFGFNKSDFVVLQCFWSLRLLMSFWIALNCFVIQRYSKALDKKLL